MTNTFVRRIATVALALPLLLAGCADDEPVPKASETSTPTPTATSATSATSATETPTSPVEPTLPPEAEGKGRAGAAAFVEHYFTVINYAQATGDTAGLRKLSLPTCRACEGGLEFIETIYARGGINEGGAYSVRKAAVTGRREVDQGVSIYYLDVAAEHTKQVISGAGDLNKTYDPGEANWRYEVVAGPKGWKIAQWAAE